MTATRPPESGDLVPRWLLRAAAYSLALLIISAAIWLVGTVVFAIPLLLYSVAVAVLATALLEPVVRFLDHRGLPRWLAAAVTELTVIGFLLGVTVLVGRRVMAQALGISQAVDRALADLQTALSEPPFSLSEPRIEYARQQVVAYVEGLALDLATGVTMALDIVSGAAIVVFVLFFLLKDGPRMWAWALTWQGTPGRRNDAVASEVWRTLASYMRGVVAVALIDAAAIGAALFVIGVPLWVSLTLLVFVGAFVPFVGATVSGALAVAVTAVTVGTGEAVIVAVVVIAVQQLEGNVLQPLIVGTAVDLHPVAVLAVVTAGWLLAGIGGAVLAVPLAAACHRLADLTVGPRSATRRPS